MRIFNFVSALCLYALASGASMGNVKISLPVDYDGSQSLLEASPSDSAEFAARKWVSDHGLGTKIDVDTILRELVYHLRTAGARSDAVDSEVIAPWRGDTIASVVVRAPLSNDGELGPPHTLSVLQGETPRQAVTGFLSRMGLPNMSADRLERILLDSIEESSNAAVAVDVDGGALIAIDEFEAPLPSSIGVSLNVTFDGVMNENLNRIKKTIHVHYGENAIAAAESFLIEAGVVDSDVRAIARKSIVDKLLMNAENAMSMTVEKSKTFKKHDEDVIAKEATVIPLAVGAIGDISSVSFDVAIEAGASLKGAARVFCVRQWESLRLPLKLASLQWAAAKRQNETIKSMAGSFIEPTIDTCVSIVFTVFRNFAIL